jgi:hypothetical protein
MTLGINIIDKSLNISLNDNGKSYGVLIDDTVHEIKDKIFVNTVDFYNETLAYYPNFVHMEIRQDNDKFKTISDNNCLVFFYDELPSHPEIYITSISNIINQDTYLEFNLDAFDLYNKIKTDDDMLASLYERLVVDFIDLTIDDLYIMIKMKFFNLNRNSSSSIISSEESENLINDIQAFFNKVKDVYKISTKQLKKETDSLSDFYKAVYLFNPKKYYENNVSLINLPNFNYTNINFVIKNKDYEEGIEGKFIKLQQIFNLLELSDNIPLIAFNDSPRRDPKIKIYNKLVNDLSENSIKSWILNEKKKLKKASYKKVRGLMIKYMCFQTTKPQNSYITLIVNENGLITVKVNFEDEDDQKSIGKIIETIKDAVDDIIDILNGLHGVFSKSRHLQDTDNSSITVSSINSILETSVKIKKSKFEKILTRFEASRLFESKDIKNDMISMYYKRFGKRNVDDDSERLGITVNIQDNPYKLNSSTITIYGGYNINQLKVIVDEIFVLSELSANLKSNIFEDSDDEDEEQVVKERTQNVKLLRQQGAKTSSTKCQKQRQPIINNETEIKNPDLVMVYKGNKYMCDNITHKYPGLTTGDIPCCFKNPGKGLENLISSKIMGIKVQPSNFTIDIKDSNGKTFTTYVVKVTSEYIEDFDLSKSRYFYYDNTDANFPLIHIHNKDLVEAINTDEKNDKDESIWLAEVPLLQIKSNPNKNTCLNIPNLHRRDKFDLHAPCKHHKKHKTFGYNANSYPCCFENAQTIYRAKKKERGTVKQHILTTDKLLGYKRLGILQPGLNKLLNEIININSEGSGAFLRWGVNQNDFSFLNCIVESISDNSELKIDSAYELRRALVNYIKQHPETFLKLNNGNISLKYGTIDNYINEINSETSIHWTDLVDLVQIALSCNIMIIDIPYVETLSKIKFEYEDMRLVCNFDVHQDRTKPFLFLIKKQNAFEIIVSNSATHWNSQSEKIQIKEKETPIINFLFKYDNTTTPIVKFFLDYYKSSCIKQVRFPDKYPYDELYDAKYVINVLKDTDDNIMYQMRNEFNKINFLVTRRGFIVPIKETGIENNIKVFSFTDFILRDKAINIEKSIEYIDTFNKSTIEPKMKLLGMTVQNGYYTGVLTNFGQIVPVRRTEITNKITLPILPIKYYYDVDQYLSGVIDKVDESTEWNSKIDNYKLKIYDIKKQLGENISKRDDVKNTIQEINKNLEMTRLQKINAIKNILKQNINVSASYPYENLDFILDNISNEIINDNIENGLLNNLITSDTFNPDEITKRSTESIWLNISDIKKWFKKFSGSN